MIIDNKSPFLHIPDNYDREQTLCLDGIRYAVEIIDIAYYNLRKNLYQLSNIELSNKDEKNMEIKRSLQTLSILHAWSIIDSINRFRQLLKKLFASRKNPLKKKDFDINNFIKDTDVVRHLRNAAQHIDDELQQLVMDDLPVWGALSWFTYINQDEGKLCISGSGTFKRHIANSKVPEGKISVLKEAPVCCIILVAHDYELDLDNTIDKVFQVFKNIENSLTQLFTPSPDINSGFLLHATVEFDADADSESIKHKIPIPHKLYLNINKR